MHVCVGSRRNTLDRSFRVSIAGHVFRLLTASNHCNMKIDKFQMLYTPLLVDRYPTPLGYIPCWATILSSFMESFVTDTGRIVPIDNQISVFIPTTETGRKTKFMDATMQTSPGLLSLPV